MSNCILAFSFSVQDILIIAILVLILFGAKHLPLFMRSLGRSMSDYQRAKEEFEEELLSRDVDTSEYPRRRKNAQPNPAHNDDLMIFAKFMLVMAIVLFVLTVIARSQH